MAGELTEDELTDIELCHFHSRTMMRLIAALRQARAERDEANARANGAETLLMNQRVQIGRMEDEHDRLCLMLAHAEGKLGIETTRQYARLPYGVHPTYAEVRDLYLAHALGLVGQA